MFAPTNPRQSLLVPRSSGTTSGKLHDDRTPDSGLYSRGSPQFCTIEGLVCTLLNRALTSKVEILPYYYGVIWSTSFCGEGEGAYEATYLGSGNNT